jgi:4-hydroxybenzoate polyprenyltransferase
MLGHLIRLIRPGQWTKNGLLFAALVFAGEVRNITKLETAVLAAALFCLLSSAMYIFNDLIDRTSDLRHPVKQHRPIASGAVPPALAVTLIVILLGIGLGGAWFVNREFFTITLIFVALNVFYTMLLKRIVIIDVISIAMSFVIRAAAGAVAIDVPASDWMLMNTLLLALFLSFGKRRHELVMLEHNAGEHRKSLSGYSSYLLDQMIAVTTPSVLVVYMLYTFSTEVSDKLGTDRLYYTIPFVVYGIFRYLYLIHSKDRGGSPVRVLLTDMPILITVVLWLITAIVILY